MQHHVGPWWGLVLLGVYHGLNPGMGWLFAVALGLQERRRMALLTAVGALGVGHLLAVGGMVGLWTALPGVVPLPVLRVLAAAALIGFGIVWWRRPRHPRWVGLRVGFGRLALWSALTAIGHGAGLMLAPFLLGPFPVLPDLSGHDWGARWVAGGIAAAAHTAGYLIAMGLSAWIVYEIIGLAFLRHLWINLDRIWAIALIVTGLVLLWP